VKKENDFRIRTVNGKKQIFDPVRLCFVPLTEEEMVRQAYLNYLMEVLKIPKIAIAVEKKIVYNTLPKRYDIVVSKPDGSMLIVVECKAASIVLDDTTLAQIAVYNSELQANYIVMFNGKEQIVFQKKVSGYQQIPALLTYQEMI
jgi:hypothetical protein